jgi:hypothetical protein
MATMYSARHYQNIASILSAHSADRRSNDDSYGEALLRDLAISFADVMEGDNPRFQRDRFLSACSADTYPFGDRRSK